MIDGLSRRYGKLPHEILALDYGDFLFDLDVAERGTQAELEEQREFERRLKHG